jgi:hypothetical protein
METQNKKIISLFLRNLAYMIDDDRLTQLQLRMVSEFYMMYLFKEEVETGHQNKSCRRKNVKKIHSPSQKEFEKFVFLGWYIYNKILNNETV